MYKYLITLLILTCPSYLLAQQEYFFESINSQHTFEIHDLFLDQESNIIWLATSQGLAMLKDDEVSLIEHTSKYPCSSIVQDAAKQIWLGTYGGSLITYNTQTIATPNQQPILELPIEEAESKSITELYIHKALNKLAIGTETGRLLTIQLPDSKGETLKRVKKLAKNENLRSLIMDGERRFLVCSLEKGLQYSIDNQWETIGEALNALSKNSSSVSKAPLLNIELETAHVIKDFEDFVLVAGKNKDGNPTFLKIKKYKTNEGSILLQPYKQASEFKTFFPDCRSSWIHDFDIDVYENIWIADDFGLMKFRMQNVHDNNCEKIPLSTEDPAFVDKPIRHLVLLNDSTLYIVSSESKIGKLHFHDQFIIPEEENTPENEEELIIETQELRKIDDLKCDQTLVLPNINFKSDQTLFENAANAKQDIKLIVDYLEANKNTSIKLIGHTELFNDPKNQLSMDRVKHVKKELQKKGIKGKRIEILAKGNAEFKAYLAEKKEFDNCYDQNNPTDSPCNRPKRRKTYKRVDVKVVCQ